jgi:capsular polysaccharide biosynthesis protein
MKLLIDALIIQQDKDSRLISIPQYKHDWKQGEKLANRMQTEYPKSNKHTQKITRYNYYLTKKCFHMQSF